MVCVVHASAFCAFNETFNGIFLCVRIATRENSIAFMYYNDWVQTPNARQTTIPHLDAVVSVWSQQSIVLCSSNIVFSVPLGVTTFDVRQRVPRVYPSHVLYSWKEPANNVYWLYYVVAVRYNRLWSMRWVNLLNWCTRVVIVLLVHCITKKYVLHTAENMWTILLHRHWVDGAIK